MSFSNLYLAIQTARHLRPSQIWHRGLRVARRKCYWRFKNIAEPQNRRLKPYHSPLLGLPELNQAPDVGGEIGCSIERARQMSTGIFCFCNKSVDYGSAPLWHDEQVSQLWRYHLHYFDCVDDLLTWSASGEPQSAFDAFRSIAISWMECNRSISGDGWHPYTISLRTVNWLNALAGFGAQWNRDQTFRQRLIDSLYGQAEFLSRDLELDVLGNHLIANLRALVAAGIAFEGAEPRIWFRTALALLERELADQILSDGGHFERSPAYHVLVLRHCLEIALWLTRNGETCPTFLEQCIRRMLDYLIRLLPPDGKLPLLKDTTLADRASAPDVLAAGALFLKEPSYKKSDPIGLYPLLLYGRKNCEEFSRWPAKDLCASAALRKSGHYVMRDDAQRDYLIFDAGKPCPDYLPAHAHADLLSYELIARGSRVIVDSGVYEYAAGQWRDYFRSTRAHNTVELNGADQSEVWSSFRVARRARPGKTQWQETEEFILAQADHDGYRRLPAPALHRRTVVWKKGAFWLVADEVTGRGLIEAANHVHFHPGLHLRPVSGSNWQIEGLGFPFWVTAFGEHGYAITRGQMEPVRQGWYSERFGHVETNTVLTLRNRAAMPFFFGYVLTHDGPASLSCTASPDVFSVEITHAGVAHRLMVPKDGNASFSALS